MFYFIGHFYFKTLFLNLLGKEQIRYNIYNLAMSETIDIPLVRIFVLIIANFVFILFIINTFRQFLITLKKI